MPEYTPAIIAVSRDCFPISLSTRRRGAVAEAAIFSVKKTVDPVLSARCATAYRRYRKIYPAMKQLFRELR